MYINNFNNVLLIPTATAAAISTTAATSSAPAITVTASTLPISSGGALRSKHLLGGESFNHGQDWAKLPLGLRALCELMAESRFKRGKVQNFYFAGFGVWSVIRWHQQVMRRPVRWGYKAAPMRILM